MKKMYPDSDEYFPPNTSPPRGNHIQVSCFVGSNHAGNKLTHCSQYGIILYCNKYPVVWYYKRQATVESSTVSFESVAL